VEKFKLPDIKEEQSVLKTVRIKVSLLKRVEKLSTSSDLSVNRIINECIEFALDNLSQEDKEVMNKEDE